MSPLIVGDDGDVFSGGVLGRDSSGGSAASAALAMMDCQAPSNAAIKVRTKQPGQPAELATTYVMLADPLSSYVSGATIAVSGEKLELRDVVANYPFLNSRVTRCRFVRFQNVLHASHTVDLCQCALAKLIILTSRVSGFRPSDS
jgi:hypothetical protein